MGLLVLPTGSKNVFSGLNIASRYLWTSRGSTGVPMAARGPFSMGTKRHMGWEVKMLIEG